jgi:hypothetical protein
MDLSRLRGGELIAGAGGIVLLVALLFLNWYSGVSVQTGFGEFEIGGELGAWDRQGFLGTLANLIILAAGIVGVGTALLTATARTVALPVAASALTAAGGVAAVAMVLLRMLFQPGNNESVDLEVGIYVALIGAVAVAYGGWQSMQEEGTTLADARGQPRGRFANGDAAGPSAAAAAEGPPSSPGTTGADRVTSPSPPVSEPSPPVSEPSPPVSEPSPPVSEPSADDEPAPSAEQPPPVHSEPPPADEGIAPPAEEPPPQRPEDPAI